MNDRYSKLNWDLVRRVEATEAAAVDAKRALSDAILELSPFRKGNIVRDKDTGALYRVEGGSGYVHLRRPSLNLQLKRVYKTGRRDASSTTFRSDYNLEKVSDT